MNVINFFKSLPKPKRRVKKIFREYVRQRRSTGVNIMRNTGRCNTSDNDLVLKLDGGLVHGSSFDSHISQSACYICS